MDWRRADAAERAVPRESAGNDGTARAGASDATEEPASGVAPAEIAATADREAATADREFESGPRAAGEPAVRDAQPAREAHSERTATAALTESFAAIRCIVSNLA